MNGKACNMCMMPFDKDTGVRASDEYCSICFKNGELVYKGSDLKEFQKMSYEGMRKNGMNPIKARLFAFSIRFAPYWKNKK